jgi:hypothetical protein
LGSDKPVSLVYIPALADEHPETINDERPRHPCTIVALPFRADA